MTNLTTIKPTKIRTTWADAIRQQSIIASTTRETQDGWRVLGAMLLALREQYPSNAAFASNRRHHLPDIPGAESTAAMWLAAMTDDEYMSLINQCPDRTTPRSLRQGWRQMQRSVSDTGCRIDKSQLAAKVVEMLTAKGRKAIATAGDSVVMVTENGDLFEFESAALITILAN